MGQYCILKPGKQTEQKVSINVLEMKMASTSVSASSEIECRFRCLAHSQRNEAKGFLKDVPGSTSVCLVSNLVIDENAARNYRTESQFNADSNLPAIWEFVRFVIISAFVWNNNSISNQVKI